MERIVLLGAPTNEQLRRTWKEDYINLPGDSSDPSSIVAWRHLKLEESPRLLPSQEIDQSAIETSYAIYCAETEQDSYAQTQLPSFEFDMQTVLDLEDLDDVPLVDKNGKAASYSTLCAVLCISAAKDIVTKAGNQTQVVIMTVGDHTRASFEIAVWGSHAQYVQKYITRLDVILCYDIVLSRFNNVLGGTSRAYRSRFVVVYRTERKSKFDDQFRPVLLNDLQSVRVKRVRDWAMSWVLSDTQPEHSDVNVSLS